MCLVLIWVPLTTHAATDITGPHTASAVAASFHDAHRDMASGARPPSRSDVGTAMPTAVEGKELAGGAWKLVRIRDRPLDAPVSRAGPHIRFVGDGRTVDGFLGCNTIRGEYAQDGPHVRFRGLATTRKVCPGVMEQERVFLTGFGRAATWNVIGNHLHLTGPQGERLLVSVRATKNDGHPPQ